MTNLELKAVCDKFLLMGLEAQDPNAPPITKKWYDSKVRQRAGLINPGKS